MGVAREQLAHQRLGLGGREATGMGDELGHPFVVVETVEAAHQLVRAHEGSVPSAPARRSGASGRGCS
jgi:hypothetical protein